jgi:hypothetical protein
MALDPFQRRVCRLLAARRIASGESYVAGGVALNELLASSRLSQDIDIFHDTDEALAASWEADRATLEAADLELKTLRQRPTFIEAEILGKDGQVILQWVRDSAFRFFPLVEHADFGMTLHAFDLATNKVLALAGRLEVRDWVDVIHCHETLQPLAYLMWAACGKDPGFSPFSLLQEARRSTRYSALEVEELAFEGKSPDAGDLSRRFRAALDQAGPLFDLLPPERVGTCILEKNVDLFRGGAPELNAALGQDRLLFHAGRIGGAWPEIVK